MGKQSARMYYRGNDHKDIYFQGNYHGAMYKGSKLVWRKLLDRYCDGGYKGIIDLKNKSKVDINFGIYVRGNNASTILAIIYDYDTKTSFFAITNDLLLWKKVEVDDNLITDNITSVGIVNSEDGFFLYFHDVEESRTVIYFLEVELGLDCTIKKIVDNSINYKWFSEFGISDFFYGIQWDNPKEYILHRISKNGEIVSKKLGYPFTYMNSTSHIESVIANTNGDVYIFCDFDLAFYVNGGLDLLHISGMDTDYITTVFSAYGSDYFDDSCTFEIIYSLYQTVILITNKGGSYIDSSLTTKSEKYAKMAYYRIDMTGNAYLLSQKEEISDVVVPLYGSEKFDSIIIKFLEDPYKPAKMVNPFEDGFIYYSMLRFDTAQDRTLYHSLSMEISDGSKNNKCIIAKYADSNFSDKELVIYIENLFWEESENNFAFLY